MAHITRDEIRKIANISSIAVDEHELNTLVQRLQEVLTYAEVVKEVALAMEQGEEVRQRNVMRTDVVHVTDTLPILLQAPLPRCSEPYFIVPKILNRS
jgi:aspartyl/glutamyl-tRNA(Asn/Gln) amidotransferase C subunit